MDNSVCRVEEHSLISGSLEVMTDPFHSISMVTFGLWVNKHIDGQHMISPGESLLQDTTRYKQMMSNCEFVPPNQIGCFLGSPPIRLFTFFSWIVFLLYLWNLFYSTEYWNSKSTIRKSVQVILVCTILCRHVTL